MKKIGLVILFLIILGVIITFYLQKSKAKMEVQKVSFVTKDGVTIVANYYPNKSAKFAGILVHMRPKTKESFDDLAKFLQNQGYALLAIDLRGHGESTESVKGKLDYNKFSEEEEKESINDLVSASLFLEKEGYPKDRQFLIGASIGANLSFQFLSENPQVKAIVLLSPGLNYRGVILENFKKEGLGEKIFVISSLDDEPAYIAGRTLKVWYPNLNYLELPSGGHGTNLFNSYSDLYEKILVWLREKLVI
jgi:pimeloyl-ACP methyl ester carboxylesterase